MAWPALPTVRNSSDVAATLLVLDFAIYSVGIPSQPEYMYLEAGGDDMGYDDMIQCNNHACQYVYQ